MQTDEMDYDLKQFLVNHAEMLADGFRITDRVQGLRAGAPVRWAMYTRAKAVREGEDVVLNESGRTLRLTRTVPAGASAWAVDEAPHGAAWECTNKGFRRLSFTVPSIPDGTEFAVTFR